MENKNKNQLTTAEIIAIALMGYSLGIILFEILKNI